ncbi:MAG TPA: hypothetical protein PLB22_12675, partial [Ottowia sp.]|nr:hypothetical protein [Ottowia sp.]
LGFVRVPDPAAPHGFDVAATVPKRRHFSSVLRALPNASLQFLLSATVELLRATLPADQQASFGDIIAGDTQALLAWVRENNPKQYIKEGRLDKNRQPNADPDCKLGVKSRPNRAPADADGDDHPAPTTDAKPASRLHVGVDIFWGYAAGIVVTRLPDHTEVVLAERTRPFNESDPSFFHPLMAQVAAYVSGASRALAPGMRPSTPSTSTSTSTKPAASPPCRLIPARRAPAGSSHPMAARCVRPACRWCGC